MFAVFAATIFSVVTGAVPILLASILGLVAAIGIGALDPDIAYSGFSEGFILLIVMAFLVGRAVVNSGLGSRIGFLLALRKGRAQIPPRRECGILAR